MVQSFANLRLLLLVIAASVTPRCYARHWTDIVNPVLYQFPGLDEYRVTMTAEKDPFDFNVITSDFAPTSSPTRPQAPTANPTLFVPPTSAPVDHWTNSVENGTCPFGQVLYEVHLLDSSNDDSDASVTMSISRIMKTEDDFGVLHTNRSADNSTTTYSEVVEIKQPTREVIFSGEVEAGPEGFQYICLETDQCYSTEVEGGSEQHEARWEIRQANMEVPQVEQIAFVPLASAPLATTTCEFSIPNEENGGKVCAVTCGSTISVDAVSGPNSQPAIQATAAPLVTTTTKQQVEIIEPTGSPTIPKKQAKIELNLALSPAPSVVPSPAPSVVPSFDQTMSPSQNMSPSFSTISPSRTMSPSFSTISPTVTAPPSEQTMSPSPVVTSAPPDSESPSSVSAGDARQKKTGSFEVTDDSAPTFAPTATASPSPTFALTESLSSTFPPSAFSEPTLSPTTTSLPTISSNFFDTARFGTIAPTTTMRPSPVTIVPTTTMRPTITGNPSSGSFGSPGTLPGSIGNSKGKEIKSQWPDAGAAYPSPSENSAPGSTDDIPITTGEQAKELFDENTSTVSDGSSTNSTNTTRPKLPSSPSIPNTGDDTSSATNASASKEASPGSSVNQSTGTKVPDSNDFAVEVVVMIDPPKFPTSSANATSNGTAPSIATEPDPTASLATSGDLQSPPSKMASNVTVPSNNRSTQPPRRPFPEPNKTSTNVTTASNETFPITKAASNGTVPTITDDSPTAPSRRPMPPANLTTSAGIEYTHVGVTIDQSASPQRRPMPPNSTTSVGLDYIPTNMSITNQSIVPPRRPPPSTNSTVLAGPTSTGLGSSPGNSSANGTYPNMNTDEKVTTKSSTDSAGVEYTNAVVTTSQSTTPQRRPPPSTNSTASAGIEYIPTNVTEPPRKPMPPTSYTTSTGIDSSPATLASIGTVANTNAETGTTSSFTASAGFEYIPTNVEGQQSPRRPMPPTNFTTSAGIVASPANVTSSGTITHTTASTRRPMPPTSSTTPAGLGSSPANVASGGTVPNTNVAPADSNNFNVEVVVMLEPSKSLAQTTAQQIQTRTRPTVSTESSFSTLNVGKPSAFHVENSSSTSSGISTIDSVNASMTLPEHTTNSSSRPTNWSVPADAAHTVYNQAASKLNNSNTSQLVRESGNVTNSTVATPVAPLESTNVTVPSSNPLYIRTRPATSPPVVGGSDYYVEDWTDDPPVTSNSRGNVRGKQQEKKYKDEIPYQNYNYETIKKNEEKRMGSNKVMRKRHRG